MNSKCINNDKGVEMEYFGTRRKISQLTMMYKLSCGLMNLNTYNLLIPSQETRTQNSHKFKYRVP